jgi:hypothetical protein
MQGQARMARGVHRLLKVLPRLAMPDPSRPCGRDTIETASQPFLWRPAHRAGGLRPSSTPLDTPRHMGLCGETLLWAATPSPANRAGRVSLARKNLLLQS